MASWLSGIETMLILAALREHWAQDPNKNVHAKAAKPQRNQKPAYFT
jgi:hypothetical protein